MTSLLESIGGLNQLSIKIFQPGSTTAVPDLRDALKNAKVFPYKTFWPDGLFGECKVFVAHNWNTPILWKQNQRLVLYNGQDTAYEGLIISVDYMMDKNGAMGLTLSCYGMWGQVFGQWFLNKPWADTRLDESVWHRDASATATGKDMITVDQGGDLKELRFTPQRVQFMNGKKAAIGYTMPTSQTIKRMTFNYAMSKDATRRPHASKMGTFVGYSTPSSVKLFSGWVTPSKVFHNDAPAGANTFTDLTNSYDDNTLTNSNVTFTSDDYWYIMMSSTFTKAKIDIGTANTNAATLSGEAWDGNTWVALSGFTDGTASAGKTLAVDGNISWTMPNSWERKTVGTVPSTALGYWVRFKASANLTAVTLVEIDVYVQNATKDTGAAFTTLTNAFDDNAGTNSSITMTVESILYFIDSERFGGIRIDLGTANTNAATMTGQYWNGDDWKTVTITDGTLSAGKTLAVDGDITFTKPSGTLWQEKLIDGNRGYVFRLYPSAALSTVTLVEVDTEDSDAYTYVDLPNTIDDDSTTYEAITWLGGTQYLHIGLRELPNTGFIRVVMGAVVNAVATTTSADYWNGDSWATLAITDGTASAGKPFAQSGDIVFTPPEDWSEEKTRDGERMYWLRLSVAKDLTANIRIADLKIGLTQSWQLRLYDRVGATSLFTLTSSTSGSQDITLGTPCQTLYFEFTSTADRQDGEDNGSVYAQITNLVVYSETGSINMATIATYLVTYNTSLNSDTAQIEAAGTPLSLVPFITQGSEPLTSILRRATTLGDGLQNAWYAQLRASDEAATKNGKPVLKLAQTPSLTDYDYQVTLGDENLKPPFSLNIDIGPMGNYIIVKYTDENGFQQEITPTDSATLTDSTSVSDYDRRTLTFDAGEVSYAIALSLGQRILATAKIPSAYVSGPLRVQGYLRSKQGNREPASLVTAGNRIRITSFLEDVMDTSNAGMTAIITGTTYDPSTQILDMELSTPDDISIMMAQLQAGFYKEIAF